MRPAGSGPSRRGAKIGHLALAVACAVAAGSAWSQAGTRSPHEGLKLECTECHTSARWVPIAPKAPFRHDKTGFPLEGSHAQLQCRSCHQSLVFHHVGTACSDCHGDVHKGSLGTRCESCHTPRTFTTQLEIFKVHDRTRLPLFARHAAVTCASCHAGQKPEEYRATPTECAACHRAALARTRDPNHVLAGFTQACETCHTGAVRAWRPASFQHAAFPLKGAHARLRCLACHAERFKGAPRDCLGCHVQAFNRAQNPNHLAGSFPTDCVGCHRETSWRPATFTDHGRTRFPLTGAHARVDCARCHQAGRYSGTSAECVACHRDRYDATRSPNHSTAGMPTACATCHTTTAWQPASFDHARTRFPLAGAHQRVACTSCHAAGRYKGTVTDCNGCHQADYKRAKTPDHVASGFPTQCGACHGANAWKPASGVDHSKTRFPLSGAHKRADCASCHSGGRLSAAPTECVGCHLADFQATKNPIHSGPAFPATCESCHSVNAWRPASFVDHNNTRFPLKGAHQRVTCAACHAGGRFAGTPTDCKGCHQSDYQGAKNPDHVGGSFPTACTNCHGVDAWRPAAFNDHDKTRFPLTGAHRRVDCARCHAGGRYSGTPTDCYGCHQASYQATRNPNHVVSNIPTACAGCHTTNAWRPATFADHDRTRFPLTGAHARVDCARCHAGGRYTGTPTDCFACHKTQFQGAKNPDHVAANLATQCASCHTTSAWRPGSFDHNATGFPLQGRHRTVSCLGCHSGGRYRGTPTDCYACHKGQFDSAKNPDHVAGSFSTKCASCHSLNGWRPATFSDHSATRFPLTGAHQRVDCARCHAGGRYSGTPTDCYACHKSQFDRTTNPGHVAGNFPTSCASCHTTGAWRPASFDHGKTRFPLQGAHRQVDCARCHAGGRYAGTPTDCYGCHRSKYEAVKDPNHVAGGFATKCDGCHSVNAWRPASFSDHGKTRFPLTGAHQRVSCTQCHTGGRYAGTPTDCVACHRAKYDATRNPNHVTAGFGTACASCHTTNAWTPATFNHGTTRFPLTGSHQRVSCTQCHTGGRYAGTPTDCVACHRAKYDATRNPNHATAGFATTCATCHTTNAWTPATFNHGTTRFPLTGSHQRVSCTQCHTGGRYAGTPTDCFACHQARYQGTRNPDHAAAGFPTTCQTCHTTAGWTPATFDHDSRYFPIYSGKHKGKWQNQCSSCHTTSSYASFECILCHKHSNKAEVDSKHREQVGYQYSSLACYRCHPRGEH